METPTQFGIHVLTLKERSLRLRNHVLFSLPFFLIKKTTWFWRCRYNSLLIFLEHDPLLRDAYWTDWRYCTCSEKGLLQISSTGCNCLDLFLKSSFCVFRNSFLLSPSNSSSTFRCCNPPTPPSLFFVRKVGVILEKGWAGAFNFIWERNKCLCWK